MVFHWNLSDSKSPQVSRTLLSSLASLSNAVVWMVSTHPFISKSSSPFINPLVTVPRAPIIIIIIIIIIIVIEKNERNGLFSFQNAFFSGFISCVVYLTKYTQI